ncbi:hypothetical protein ACFLZJ_00365 [Nanoarchaeota archaeon]
MRNKNIGWLFFGLSLFFLVVFEPLSLTGYSVAGAPENYVNYLQVMGIGFLLLSLMIFASSRTLDAIIIPTSPSRKIDRKRANRGVRHPGKVYVISGKRGNVSSIRETQRYGIYKELRKYGIKPSKMMVEGQSRNSEQNLLYSFRKLKERGAKDIGIASAPGHLKKFEVIKKYLENKGLIDSEMRLHRLETDHELSERLYNFLGLQKYRAKKVLRKVKRSKR